MPLWPLDGLSARRMSIAYRGEDEELSQYFLGGPHDERLVERIE